MKDISMKDEDKITDKIKKLLNLANNNPNENEAIDAALKAQELMAKYNIEFEDIKDGSRADSENIIEEIVSIKKNSGYCIKWRFQLSQIIAKNFRVKSWSIGRDDIVFYGFESDVKIAVSVFNFLFNTGNKLSTRYYYRCKDAGLETRGVMNSWLIGFLRGLADVLEKQCTALMIVTPAKVEKSYEEISKNFISISSKINSSGDINAYEDGRSEGRSAATARSLEASA